MSGRPQPARRTVRPRVDVQWQQQAACVGTDPEVFFPGEKVRITVGVRRICEGCDVRAACLEYALAQGEWFGVWGGCSADERRNLARKRGRKVPA